MFNYECVCECVFVCVLVCVCLCVCLHMCDMLLYKGAYIASSRVAVVALLVVPCHVLYLKWGMHDKGSSNYTYMYLVGLYTVPYRVFCIRLPLFVFGYSALPRGVLSAFCFLACLTFQIHIESSAYLHSHTDTASHTQAHTHMQLFLGGFRPRVVCL